MGKIVKDTVKYLPSCKSLKIFKYEKCNKYYCCYYVGPHASTSGSKIKSLRTENINDAMKKAKIEYYKWFEEHGDDYSKKDFDFTKDIANPFSNLEYENIQEIIKKKIKVKERNKNILII